MKKTFLAMAMLLGSTVAMAQFGQNNPYDQNTGIYNGGYNDGSQAEQIGYTDGMEHGRVDRSQGVSSNFRDENYKRGDHGYSSDMGSRDQYKQAYRSAYEQGYNDGYTGNNQNGGIYNGGRGNRDHHHGRRGNGSYSNGSYGNNGSTTSRAASQLGYRDGVWYAQQDMAKGRREDPSHAKGYKDADHGYTSSYNREEFKQAYRQAFIQGYQQTAGGNVNGNNGDYDNDGDNHNGSYGNGSFGNNNGYGSETSRVAADIGYRDGVWYAQQDLAKGRQQDPSQAKGYKDADHGYTSSYKREEFKQAYRQAFTQGYQQTIGNGRY